MWPHFFSAEDVEIRGDKVRIGIASMWPHFFSAEDSQLVIERPQNPIGFNVAALLQCGRLKTGSKSCAWSGASMWPHFFSAEDPAREQSRERVGHASMWPHFFSAEDTTYRRKSR